MKVVEFKNGELTYRDMKTEEILEMNQISENAPQPNDDLENQVANLTKLVNELTEQLNNKN